MAACQSCRLVLRHAFRLRPFLHRSMSSKPTPSPSPSQAVKDMFSKPTWSVRSLLSESSNPDTRTEKISSSQLHHLLRLSALPLPKSQAEEDSMIATLESQLQFVRAVQRVDTTGVEPLRAIRDETVAAVKETAIGLEDLKEVLDKEELVGYYQRPKRVKVKVESEAEKWDPLATATKRAGRYFVVESGKKSEDEAAG